MSIQVRRERERAERERLIVGAAREPAEAEGWEAVTTRRPAGDPPADHLADTHEYSRPALYCHFTGKDAIMAAVAVEGVADMAAEMRAARTSASGPEQALADVAAAHGLMTLTRGGRLPPEHHERRLALLLRRFAT
ncbi:hypothetical protein ACFY05_17585 [Microtetraspora fusca]|uniref:TetR family transcriptional regulator n=1 Tax=Microtetraspora fusca TaxID=1997 RepID=A0ABW6V6V5_MICFU